MKKANKVVYPHVSVITPTYNSSATIDKCLKSIREQDYPQDKIELVIADGGSKDDTLQRILKYKVKLFNVPPEKQNVEYNKSVGIKKSTGELLLMMDHDNVFPNKNVLKNMVQPFLDHKDMVGVETIHYHYSPKMTLLDRYFALFGVTDPLAFYLGKADRMTYYQKTYAAKYKPEAFGKYFIVHFNKDNIPTLGANGFMIRKSTLVNNANISSGNYLHIDVNVDLILKGYNKYAFVKDSVAHIAGHGSVGYYLKRRMRFMKQFYLSEDNVSVQQVRRYSLYEKKDIWKLLYFILISMTIVIPTLTSLWGYIKKPDVAWFVHPILCFGFVIMYGYVILEHQCKLMLKNK